MTEAFVIAAMFALILMHNLVLGDPRCCPMCGGRRNHHDTCPFNRDHLHGRPGAP
jgi:hypothetical protein